MRRVQRVEQQILQRTGRKATCDELATESGFDEARLKALLALPGEPALLDMLLADGEGALPEIVEDQKVNDHLRYLSTHVCVIVSEHCWLVSARPTRKFCAVAGSASAGARRKPAR
ncbi:sigma-70 domain-containing protein [Paraburkholderia diazotrophica]|uniref:sigma-70 domain-containing protein n=1 Tax=Paraburkholderia diazotrophica TaxID=667676 RepID=UPI001C42FB72|nr:sigma-70 domain-containing protein [Paraburkholderia diazotrophica]